MGLGLYGGASYNQGCRSRDGWDGGGSLGNQETNLYLGDSFAGMGLNVTVQGSYKNVVGELRGTQTPQKVYIVGGHYDTYGNGEKPGGDDNASGTAGVLEAARVLSRYSFASTIRFIGFNAEEDWMLGSQDYVNSIVASGKETIAGMINLDMILRPLWDGDPSQQKDADLTTDSTTPCLAWANKFLDAASIYTPLLAMDQRNPNTEYWGASDQAPFIAAGLPAVGLLENTVYEIWGGSNAYYHTSQDASDGLANNPFNPSGVTYDYLFATDIVRVSVATLAQEAQIIPEPASAFLMIVGAGILRLRHRKR
jgi:Zn-dependent M28 family amino/carboxypeptidase